MLARHMLSSCVRPSVCPSQPGVLSKWLNRSICVLAQRQPSVYPTLCFTGIPVSSKIRVLPSGTLFKTLDLENFATARRPLHVLSTRVDAQCDKLATVVGHQFITLSVHLCVQHYGHEAARQAGLSASAETCQLSCGMRQKRRNVPHDAVTQRNAAHLVSQFLLLYFL